MYKLIGALVGFFSFGFFGGILGWILGALVGRAVTFGPGAINPFATLKRQAVFLETLFSLMGRLAKSDGHISRQEIDHVEAFMAKLNMSGEHRQKAIHQFKRGAEPEFDVDACLDNFLAHCGHARNLKQVMLVYLVGVALADGVIQTAEENLLHHVAGRLGFDARAFAQLLNMMRGQDHFSGFSSQVETASTIDEAYAALGVTPDHSDQQIKKAYRQLMSEYHPDKLIGQGLPEDMIKGATERAQEIQNAYELIKKHRAGRNS
ncbi:MAG: co-chaperone DjlA [Pseudomonadales bacterium]|nr:co-chaperone DjlA [Pseudomonadales bacterium]